MPSHEMNNGGDCLNIDWESVTSKVTYYGLDGLPEPIRKFYVVGQVIANSAVCDRHRMNLLTGYLNALDDASYWAIPEFCDPDFSRVQADSSVPSVDRCLMWMETLAAKWPLPASMFTDAGMYMLAEEQVWMEVFFWCSGCMGISGQSKDQLWELLGFAALYITADGRRMVDGLQGESLENDLPNVSRVDAV